jgi:hypothetical protein
MKSFYVSDASDFLLSQRVVVTVAFELHACRYQLLEECDKVFDHVIIAISVANAGGDG